MPPLALLRLCGKIGDSPHACTLPTQKGPGTSPKLNGACRTIVDALTAVESGALALRNHAQGYATSVASTSTPDFGGTTIGGCRGGERAGVGLVGQTSAPKKYWDLYDQADFGLFRGAVRTLNAPDVAYPDHLELGGYKDVPKDERVSTEQARHLRHGYYACVSYVDAQVGKLLDALGRLGLEENTIVVLWGDHGYSLGEADHWCKDTNSEMDTRTPFAFHFPGMPEPGVATEAMMEYVSL